MSSWNIRVLRKAGADADEVSYQIHEVFYDEDGSIQSWTLAPVTVYGETLAELREEIRHFLHACRRPVLEEREVDGRPVLVADDGDDPINPGHYFEFMDRASVATDYVYQFLGSHPLIKKEPSLCALYDKAEAALAELYQEAGRLEYDRNAD
ncbi:hypothetical protein [uncultured Thiodictyon sp.]|jgi:hypothetical protein|uniref:hypothetical protein n=1 Tax=uncultured Thiodictyon sp. TaxID=1846217 RepID=UPI0025DE57DC|nr:hypothetical protein [uncultured Thiodictyon sp.]